ncbi:hypothetical protein TDB9533_04012 [Thalassocella blandensis]|nr:hypothetical protein TDB9533_04012 [Thalassocella blandensis]
MQTKAIQQYLTKYAEADSATARRLFNSCEHPTYHHALVIPVLAEQIAFVDRWINSQHASNNLLILVINQHEDCDASQSNANRVLFDALLLKSDDTIRQDHVYYLKIQSTHILLIDRFQAPNQLQKKQGVGHARKIGCDIAVQLIQANMVQSPWIYSTDADAILPGNYFADDQNTHINTSSLDNNLPNVAAKVFNFTHVDLQAASELSDRVLQSTRQYESAIKYYRDALHWAGSPYAFHTLGSTLAVNINAYCQVRGFPKRAGAEDFYLLNKLAKVGKVESEPTICIQIQARLSKRVPFGTGPAVEKIIHQQEQDQPYVYYSPQCFIPLKLLYSHLPALLETVLITGCVDWKVLHDKQTHGLNPATVEQLQNTMQALGIDAFCRHATKQCRTTSAVLTQFHQWFDAFLTLKFVRHIQHGYAPAKNLKTCLIEFDELRIHHG